jgi:hypothetical protein
MNQDRNNIPLSEAPATVDGKAVLKVLQISISDNEAESGYKVILEDASQAVVQFNQFQAGADVTTVNEPSLEQIVIAEQPPQVAPDQPITGQEA